jgi:hypothetical protein
VKDESGFGRVSTGQVLRFVAAQVRPWRGRLFLAWGCVVIAVIAAEVVGPLIFATILGRIAALGPHAGLSGEFTWLLVAYGVTTSCTTQADRLGDRQKAPRWPVCDYQPLAVRPPGNTVP